MSKKHYPYVFHEINSPSTSLSALIEINPLPPDLKNKFITHLTRLNQASLVLSSYLCSSDIDPSVLIKLLNIYTSSTPTINSQKYSWPIPSISTKPEFQKFLWQTIKKITRLNNLSLTRQKNTIELLLPSHLQP